VPPPATLPTNATGTPLVLSIDVFNANTGAALHDHAADGAPDFPAQVEHFEFDAGEFPSQLIAQRRQPGAFADLVEITIGLGCIGNRDRAPACQRRGDLPGDGGDDRAVGDDLLPLVRPLGVGFANEIGFEQDAVAGPDQAAPIDWQLRDGLAHKRRVVAWILPDDSDRMH